MSYETKTTFVQLLYKYCYLVSEGAELPWPNSRFEAKLFEIELNFSMSHETKTICMTLFFVKNTRDFGSDGTELPWPNSRFGAKLFEIELNFSMSYETKTMFITLFFRQ